MDRWIISDIIYIMIMTCMTEGVKLGQKGLWHGMGAHGAFPWQGTRFYNAWARLGLKPMLVECIMTSSACMMTHNV